MFIYCRTTVILINHHIMAFKMNNKLNILMLAWRDMKNPKMGGAEIVTDVYLSELVEDRF